MGFPVAVAQLCEGILYGLFLVTWWFSTRTLLFRNTDEGVRLVPLRKIRWLLTIVSMMFSVISTWDVAAGILYLFNTFTKAGDITAKLNGPLGWTNTARILNQVLAILLCDFVLVFRCWIIYEKRWSIIAPSLILFLGVIAVAIRVIQLGGTTTADEFLQLNFCAWTATMFGVHALQNILTSGMLVWRIWCVRQKVDMNTNHPGGLHAIQQSPLQRFMRAVAESGAVYTVTVFATFLASVARSNAVYIAVDMSLQTAGIASNLIIIRSIETDDQGVCIGVAGSQTRTHSLIFSHPAQDASGSRAS